ncbi:MAG: 4-vinyl reductase [Chloroflexi bacterium]|nr:4-vinyl reductase [Chloroflexota bacterium]MBK6711705.1 4-vinyl reductase [Chloroflexota bacterium]MBK7177081.1 4-vinyl reductase [Chloroflexota bacterium]MBK7920153.1 4-vinyl reductase [Chloroflexota bacterium]MBK8931528.1 4-vinyl reductase [Chloroflexota bacterium]
MNEIIQKQAQEIEEFYYPNKMGRIVLTAMEEIMGRHGVNAILNLAQLQHLVNNYPPNNLEMGFTFNEFSAIQETLDAMYGVRGGRGLAMRAGRETWRLALKEFVPVLGISDLAIRTLPLGIKIKIGLDIFAQTFNKFSDQQVRLGEDQRGYLWIIERCPICWQRSSSQPCCHLAVGLLEQSLDWVSRGRRFRVEEVSCVAKGDATCTILISKKPIA